MNLEDAKRSLTELKSEKDELIGEKKIYIKQLKEVSGCKSTELAKKKHAKLKLEIKNVSKAFLKGEKAFEDKYGHLL